MKYKEYCKCKYCGYTKAEVDTGNIINNFPPEYKYRCSNCKKEGYIKSNEKIETLEEYIENTHQ